MLLWKPLDSIRIACDNVFFVTADTFLCLSSGRDSIFWVDMASKKVFHKIALPPEIRPAVNLALAPAGKDYPCPVFVLGDFRRLYLLSREGRLLCDFSEWIAEEFLEIYGTGNIISLVNDTQFIANIDVENPIRPRPDSNLAVFSFHARSCAISLQRFLLAKFPAGNLGKKYMVSFAPNFTLHDSLLLVTYSVIDTLYVHAMPSGKLMEKIPIQSSFYERPSPFSYGDGFRSYRALRRAISAHRRRNAWIGKPVVLNSGTYGVAIMPATPPSRRTTKGSPTILWLHRDTTDADVVFRTDRPAGRLLGVAENTVYLVSGKEHRQLTVYQFKVTPSTMACVSRETAIRSMWRPFEGSGQQLHQAVDSFMAGMVQNTLDSAVLWLPTGCAADIAVLPEDARAYRHVTVLTASESLKHLLPGRVRATTPPDAVAKTLRAMFPTSTLFIIQNGRIADTFTEAQVMRYFHQHFPENTP